MDDKNKRSNITKIIVFSLLAILLFSLYDSAQKSSQISKLNNEIEKYESKVSTTKDNSNTYKSQSIKPSTNYSQNSTNDYSNSEIVYVTNTGSKYHCSGCSYLKSKNAITKTEAINKGYAPCSRCKP